jgi:hypothetical protein
MNTKRLALASLAVYVATQALNYLIHEVWLSPTYASMASVWRPQAEMESKMWIMFVTSAFFSFFFCYIFAKGYEGKGLMEGARFGAVIGLFYSLPVAYESYVIYPLPYHLALQWFGAGFGLCVVLGLLAAAIYRKA